MLTIERPSRVSNHVLYRYQYPDIKRYDIYDHLLAYSMKFYGIDKIVTLNKADFERYDFIKEIIAPSAARGTLFEKTVP